MPYDPTSRRNRHSYRTRRKNSRYPSRIGLFAITFVLALIFAVGAGINAAVALSIGAPLTIAYVLLALSGGTIFVSIFTLFSFAMV